MLEKADRILVLLRKHRKGELSIEEKKELEDWISQSEETRGVFREVSDEYLLKPNEQFKEYYDLQQEFAQTPTSAKVVQLPITKRSWFKWVAAASTIIFIAFGSYFIFFYNNKNAQQEVAKANNSYSYSNDVPPGTFKAKLTLADGTAIILDSAAMGELAKQGNTVVINKDGQLVYSASDGVGKEETLYNTLSTANGETYSTILADGSKVWLNAASSIRYPVKFTGKDRKVEITGEAYFEVEKDAAKPFYVTVNGMEVQVLGTHFNISAYNEEAEIKTSLLEGKVKVNFQNKQSRILMPGQQANVDKGGTIQVVNATNVEDAVAWKNGIFHFESADMKAVMRQLARWYDVNVVFEASVYAGKITGNIERNIPLSRLLANLEKMAPVHFKIEGKKIIVTP